MYTNRVYISFLFTMTAAIDVTANRLLTIDERIHEWYRFTLSYPAHLVREIIEMLDVWGGDRILDPFCGTGTTLIEARLAKIDAVGYETNPILGMVCSAKLNWQIDFEELMRLANLVIKRCKKFDSENPDKKRSLSQPVMDLLIKGSIHPRMLHQCLSLKHEINKIACGTPYHYHLNTVLAKVIHTYASNLRFAPSPTVRKISDEDIKAKCCYIMFNKFAKDMHNHCIVMRNRGGGEHNVFIHDSRIPRHHDKKFDALITSPPYPTEHDYTRFTRLESVILGFTRSKESLRATKDMLLRSNSKNIYKHDCDSNLINNASINSIISQIKDVQKSKNNISGFEAKYNRVVGEYFGGMYRNLLSIHPNMHTGSKLAYVVGDQNSYYNIPIKTAELLGEIAEQSQLYKVLEIKTFRHRAATAINSSVAENILILEAK